MKPKNPPATRFKYAPNLEEGDLVLLIQGSYSWPVIFGKDTGHTVQTYTIGNFNIERLEQGKKMYAMAIYGSHVTSRLVRIPDSYLTSGIKKIYHKIKKLLIERDKKQEEKEQKKALKKVVTKEGIAPGNVVIVNSDEKGITTGKDYFVQMVDKKHRQIMLVDDTGFPAWHKSKHFVKREEVIEKELA